MRVEAGSNDVLCADSHARVDRQELSAPRMPSESNDGGLFNDVLLQINHGWIYAQLSIAEKYIQNISNEDDY